MPACALLAAGCGARLCPDGHPHAQVWVQAAGGDAARHAGGPADAGCNLWVNREPVRTERKAQAAAGLQLLGGWQL